MSEQHYFNIIYEKGFFNPDEVKITAAYSYPGVDVGYGYMGKDLDESLNKILENLKDVSPAKIVIRSGISTGDRISGSMPLSPDDLTLLVMELSDRRKDMSFVEGF